MKSLFNICSVLQLLDLYNLGMTFIIENGEITSCKITEKKYNNLLEYVDKRD
jgi:hypothetical protein